MDREIERTFCRRIREEKQILRQPQNSTMEENFAKNVGAKDHWVLCYYAILTVNEASTSIRRPVIQANNFEIKFAII